MKKNVFLAVALTALMAAGAFAQEYNSESDFQVKKAGNGITITKYVGTVMVVNILPTIQNLPVTSIGNNAFKGTKITSVTIPDSVTSIGENAFRNCKSLTSVTIGNGVISIGNNAFMSCTSLTSVIIPDSVTSIGINAFFLCGKLASVTIGKGVTRIEDNAFGGCAKLESVTFQGTNRNITDWNTMRVAFVGDLANKYYAGGAGTYNRSSGTWTNPNAPAASQNNEFNIFAEASARRQQQVAAESAAEQRDYRRSSNNPLERTTWIQSDGKGYQVLSFDGPSNSGSSNNNSLNMHLRTGDNINWGTCTVSGDKVTITLEGRNSSTITGTIAGNVITLDAYGTFTRQ